MTVIKLIKKKCHKTDKWLRSSGCNYDNKRSRGLFITREQQQKKLANIQKDGGGGRGRGGRGALTIKKTVRIIGSQLKG